MLLCGLVSRVMYSAVCLASEILRHLAMVGWQFGRIGYGTTWMANGFQRYLAMLAKCKISYEAMSL